MKKLNIALALILSLMLLITGCSKDTPDSTDTSDTTVDASDTSDTTGTGDTVTTGSFGGALISEYKQVTYYGDALKASADRIAAKLESLGAVDVEVAEGAPTTDMCAVVLGCEEGDYKLSQLADDQAAVYAENSWVCAYVNSDVFGHEYAANLLESYIGKTEYEAEFDTKTILHEVKAMGNRATTAFDASKGNVVFSGTTKKNAIEYKCGEEMVFEITLMQSGKTVSCKEFECLIKCDDGKDITVKADGSTGKLQITTAATTPGFVRLVVKAFDQNGNEAGQTQYTANPNPTPGGTGDGFNPEMRYYGGAGADIAKIEQSIAEPADFDEFWAGALAELDEVNVSDRNSPNVKVTQATTSQSGYKTYYVQLKYGNGNAASLGVLTVPDGAQNKSLNAKIVFQAHSNTPNMSNPQYLKNTMVFAVTPHGLPTFNSNPANTDVLKNAYNNQTLPSNYGFDSNQNKNPETSYFYNMILRDVQAARYLISRPEYNGTGLIFENGSMGAMQAINTASLIGADNVKTMKIDYAWLSNFGCAATGIQGPLWGPNVTPTADEDGNVSIVEQGILYFDPVNHAKRITKAEVTLMARLGDYVCPPSGQIVLFKAFATEAKSMTIKQNGTHGYESSAVLSLPVKFED